jgi:hypothetical protein
MIRHQAEPLHPSVTNLRRATDGEFGMSYNVSAAGAHKRQILLNRPDAA